MESKRILIVNTSVDPSNIEHVNSIVDKLNANTDIKHYTEISDSLENYDGIILSGQPIDDPSYETEQVQRDYAWVKDIQVPLLGICGGHQVIGIIYGSEVITSEEEGVYDVIVDIEDPIIRGLKTFKAYSQHKDAITLPSDFIQLAHTHRCENAMMKHKDKPIYGTQFHPENPKDIEDLQESEELIKNFEEIV